MYPPISAPISTVSTSYVKNGRISLTSDGAIPVTILIPGPAGLSSMDRCAAQSEKRGMMKMLNAGNCNTYSSNIAFEGPW